MPSTEDILSSLKFVSYQYIIIAIAWHVVIYLAFIISAIRKINPTTRLMGFLISTPMLSVAIISALADNFFNAFIFLLLGSLVFLFGVTSGKAIRVTRINPVGLIFILCGLLYPHFTDDLKLIFLTAPVGLIPCPTLLLTIGLWIFVGSPSFKITVTLIIAGLFYGLFGIFRLDVLIDILLIASIIPLCWRLIHKQNQTTLLQNE